MQPQWDTKALENVEESVWHYDMESDTLWCRGPVAALLGAKRGRVPRFGAAWRRLAPAGTFSHLLVRLKRAPDTVCCVRVRARSGTPFLLRCKGVWEQERLSAISGTCAVCDEEPRGAFPDLSEENRLLPQLSLQGQAAFGRRLRGLLADAGGSVLQLNIDDFGAINDCYGYALGDALLEQVGAFLSAFLKENAAYAGGGRFWLFFAPPCAPESVRQRLAPLLGRFARPWLLGLQRVYISASVGVADTDGGERDVRQLFAHAEMAAGEARGQGGVCFFEKSMRVRVHHRMEVEKDLRAALEEGRFTLFYQPQVEPQKGRISGMEALLRWVSPENERVLPPEFIPVAEKTGLILPIGEWVLYAACLQMRHWLEQPDAPRTVAVNLSPSQFAQADLSDTVERILRQTGLDPCALELEITEQAVMNDLRHAADTLERLRGMGVQVALDDFGTGYSSLNYLRQLPIQKLKIDRSFVTGIVGQQKERVIAGSIIRMAHDLSLTVVAEGVENKEQLEILCGQGCDLIQGFLYSRPVPEEQMQCMLASQAGEARP